MDRHIDTTLLSAYHDGRLGPAQGEIVRRHVEACGRCGRALADLRRADDLVRLAAPCIADDESWRRLRAGVLAATVERPGGRRSLPRRAPWMIGAGLAAAAAIAALAVLLRPEPPIDHLDFGGPLAVGRPQPAAEPALGTTSPAALGRAGRTAISADAIPVPPNPADVGAAILSRPAAPASVRSESPRVEPSMTPPARSPVFLSLAPALPREVVVAPADGAADPRATARLVRATFDAAEHYLTRIEALSPSNAAAFAELNGRLKADRVLERLMHVRRRAGLDSALRTQAAVLEALFMKFTLAAGDYLSRDIAAAQRDIHRVELRRAAIEEARRWLAALRTEATALASL
jgi:hypothetical protein